MPKGALRVGPPRQGSSLKQSDPSGALHDPTNVALADTTTIVLLTKHRRAGAGSPTQASRVLDNPCAFEVWSVRRARQDVPVFVLGRLVMAVALLSAPASMTLEQYGRVIKQLEGSGAGAPPGRRLHACFGPRDQLMVFELWDTMEDFQAFGTTLTPILAKEQIEMTPLEPQEIHGLIEGGDAGSLRRTIESLREKAFFRRPVEKLREKVHKAKD